MLVSANNVAHLLEVHLPSPLLAITHAITSVSSRSGINAYMVGGSVRDLFLSYPIHDLDILIEGNVVTFGQELAKELGGKVKSISQFETIKLELLGQHVDVAQARQEHYQYPGALPHVKPASIHADLLRRDFTINAMAISLHQSSLGTLLTAEGSAEDISDKFIRVLHKQSFRDDATRLIRAIRYEQRFNFRLEKQTEELAKRNASIIETIGGDRIRKEITLLLQEPFAANCLKRLNDLGILSKIHPTLKLTPKTYQALGNAPTKTPIMTLWALVAHQCNPKQLDSLERRLNLPRTWVRTILDVIKIRQKLPRLEDSTLRPSLVYQMLADSGLHAIKAWILLERSTTAGTWLRHYLKKLRMTKTILKGDDLIALGIPKGPTLGILLRELLDGRLNRTLSTVDDEIDYIRRKA